MRCSTDFGTDALTVYQYFPRPRTYFDHCTHACTLFFYADAVADASPLIILEPIAFWF
jgi:hypothetical protein